MLLLQTIISILARVPVSIMLTISLHLRLLDNRASTKLSKIQLALLLLRNIDVTNIDVTFDIESITKLKE